MQCVWYLTNDILVSESYNQPVLGCIVLVAILDDEAFSRIIISLALCQCDNIAQVTCSSMQLASVVFTANYLTGTDKKNR